MIVLSGASQARESCDQAKRYGTFALPSQGEGALGTTSGRAGCARCVVMTDEPKRDEPAPVEQATETPEFLKRPRGERNPDAEPRGQHGPYR
jgi:hypothetical protein